MVYGCFCSRAAESSVMMTEAICSLQSLKYLLSGPLKKIFADTCSGKKVLIRSLRNFSMLDQLLATQLSPHSWFHTTIFT